MALNSSALPLGSLKNMVYWGRGEGGRQAARSEGHRGSGQGAAQAGAGKALAPSGPATGAHLLAGLALRAPEGRRRPRGLSGAAGRVVAGGQTAHCIRLQRLVAWPPTAMKIPPRNPKQRLAWKRRWGSISKATPRALRRSASAWKASTLSAAPKWGTGTAGGCGGGGGGGGASAPHVSSQPLQHALAFAPAHPTATQTAPHPRRHRPRCGAQPRCSPAPGGSPPARGTEGGTGAAGLRAVDAG
jgi:hypothetical protein